MQKRKGYFEQRTLSKKKQRNFDNGWLKRQRGGLHSFFLNLLNLRDLFGI